MRAGTKVAIVAAAFMMVSLVITATLLWLRSPPTDAESASETQVGLVSSTTLRIPVSSAQEPTEPGLQDAGPKEHTEASKADPSAAGPPTMASSRALRPPPPPHVTAMREEPPAPTRPPASKEPPEPKSDLDLFNDNK